jgi:hypothetical protein
MRPAAQESAVPAPALRWTDRVIEAGVLFLLVFTPLAFGTVQPWSEAIAELVILAMVVVWLVGMLRDWEVRIELPPGWLPAYLFLALVFLQASALPAVLVGAVSPWTAGLHQAAWAYAGSSSALMPLSLAPHATWRMALKLAAVAAVFLVCYNVYRTRAQVVRAAWTMVVVGSAIALLGIAQRMSWTGRLYWLGPESPGPRAFGPFVNPAHFAGLIVVVVPIAIALTMAAASHRRRLPLHGWRDRLRRWNSERSGPTRLVPFLIALMGAAALVSGTRGGLLALLTTLVVMLAIGAHGSAGRGRAARVASVTLLMLVMALWIGGDVFWGTLGSLTEDLERPAESPRLRLWADAVHLSAEAPAVGTGLGSFGFVYPLVRTIRMPVTFTHAESDWAQLLLDTGVIGLALAGALAVALGLALLRGVRGARSPWNRTLALAGLVALVGAVVQGMGNFNLVVTSNAVYLGIALAMALGPEPRSR